MKAHVVVSLGVLALIGTAFPSCTCGTPPPPPGSGAVGEIVAVPHDGGFDLVLRNLQRPVRDLQVDVKLAGANATQATSSADVIEAGLGVPKGDFTVVVGDTRRLNLPSGALVHVVTDAAPSSITLSRALAVDDSGAKRDVTVVVP